VVVPTRNRPQLAVAAARSVREQDAEVRVVVSDNSADPAAAEALGRACAELPDVH
jgi:glycosyltransferase involved in cell wall biosynthesis